MNVKLKDRTLICADIIEPEMVVAEFSDALTFNAIKNLVADIEFGQRARAAYRDFRFDGQNISAAAKMCKELDEVYADDAYARMMSRKKQ